MKIACRQLILQTVLLLGWIGYFTTPCESALVYSQVNNGSATAYDSNISSVDLINVGNPLRESVSNSGGTWDAGAPVARLTDGTSAHSFLTAGPATVTYTFDTNSNFLGYDIQNISSIFGWINNAQSMAGQVFNVYYSLVGTPSTFTKLVNPLAPTDPTVNYSPFVSNVSGSSWVSITDNSPGQVIVSGVKAIQFEFVYASPGRVVREIDVFGTPTIIPEPSSLALLLLGIAGLSRFRMRCK